MSQTNVADRRFGHNRANTAIPIQVNSATPKTSELKGAEVIQAQSCSGPLDGFQSCDRRVCRCSDGGSAREHTVESFPGDSGEYGGDDAFAREFPHEQIQKTGVNAQVFFGLARVQAVLCPGKILL
jgi:hypothetical protein